MTCSKIELEKYISDNSSHSLLLLLHLGVGGLGIADAQRVAAALLVDGANLKNWTNARKASFGNILYYKLTLWEPCCLMPKYRGWL